MSLMSQVFVTLIGNRIRIGLNASDRNVERTIEPIRLAIAAIDKYSADLILFGFQSHFRFKLEIDLQRKCRQ